ncbi:MAG TPA: 3-hydroxyacyl-ACP dehydratase FabZ [Polyangiaceae bacterium]|nr:3-hydroxyacyl-ACP dehydratase FabZ [Polyangiaceae bacterium]
MEDPLRIDIPKILEILPQRYPLLLVDRVTAIDPGKNIKGHKMVSYNEPWASGHFPAQPILPGVLILEALAQLGAILAYVTEPFDPSSNVLYLLGIDKAKFRQTVIPGDRLDLVVDVLHHRSNVWKFRGTASIDGTLSATADLLASVVDRED